VKKGLAGEPEFAQPPAAGALEAGDFPGQEGELWELSQQAPRPPNQPVLFQVVSFVRGIDSHPDSSLGFFQDTNCDWHKSSLSLLFGKYGV